jgi:hypothetical protein
VELTKAMAEGHGQLSFNVTSDELLGRSRTHAQVAALRSD